MEDLPSAFDVVIVGTGLTESIISAAVARVGHSVLHLDPRDYYGGKWGTMCWNSWTSGSFSQIPDSLRTQEYRILGSFEADGILTNIAWRNDVRDYTQVWYTESSVVIDEVNSLSRRFNVDILPKVLMAREETISLLIHSNVSRYLQFSCIKRLMSSLPHPNESIIEPIPLSRSDIFTSKSISLIEKRKLMKFIEYVLKSGSKGSGGSGDQSGNDSESSSPRSTSSSSSTTKHEHSSSSTLSPDSSSKTFVELAKMHNLSPKVQHLIHSAVRTMDDCMENSGTSDDEEGQNNFNLKFTQNCRLFLQSINRYGNQTPFLWTLYGISEICQSFCRLSAIYGGTFILNRSIESISEDRTTEDNNSLINVQMPGTSIKCKYLVLGPEFKFETESRSKSPKCRQGITLVRGALLISGDSSLLGGFPNHHHQQHQAAAAEQQNEPGGSSTVYRFGDMDVIELDETSLAVPKNYRLLQVTIPYREGNPSPRQTIESRLEAYVNFNPNHSNPSTAGTTVGTKSLSSQSAPATHQPSPSDQPTPTCSSSLDKDRDSRPTVVHGAYFLIDFYDDIKDTDIQNPKIYSCATSSTELTDHVEKAREIFNKMFPMDDFLPKAPDAPEYAPEEELEEDVEMGMVGGGIEEAHVRPGPGRAPPVPPEQMDGHGPQDHIIANHFDDHPQMDFQNGVVDGE